MDAAAATRRVFPFPINPGWELAAMAIGINADICKTLYAFIIINLALFLSRGQIDLDKYIDRSPKTALGNPRRDTGPAISGNVHG